MGGSWPPEPNALSPTSASVPCLNPDPRLTSHLRLTSDLAEPAPKPSSARVPGSWKLFQSRASGEGGQAVRSPGATFTAVSLLINTPTPTPSHRGPRQLVGPLPHPSPQEAGFSPLGEEEGGKRGHGAGGSAEEGSTPERLGCGFPVPLITQSQARVAAAPEPHIPTQHQRRAGPDCPRALPGQWVLAWPLPAVWGPRTYLDPTHREPAKPPKETPEPGAGSAGPWGGHGTLGSSVARAQARMLLLRKEKGLSQSFSLKRKISYFLPSPAPAQDFVPDPGGARQVRAQQSGVQPPPPPPGLQSSSQATQPSGLWPQGPLLALQASLTNSPLSAVVSLPAPSSPLHISALSDLKIK